MRGSINALSLHDLSRAYLCLCACVCVYVCIGKEDSNFAENSNLAHTCFAQEGCG